MRKITLPAAILMIASLVIVNHSSAQSLEQQKPIEKNQPVKPDQNEAVAPNVVKSLNNLTGDVSLQAGANITVTPSGNRLIVAAPNALASVTTDASLTGNGTPASPLRVAPVVDTTARFSESFEFTISPNIGTGGVELMTVPAGKRLVVENVSAQCIGVPAGQFISKFEISIYGSLPKRSRLFLVSVFSGGDPGLGNIYVASSPVKFYVDAGYTVQGNAWRGSVSSGTIYCSFNYSGSLIEQP